MLFPLFHMFWRRRAALHAGRLISVTVQGKIEIQQGMRCNHKINLRHSSDVEHPHLHLVFNILKLWFIMRNMSALCFVLLFFECYWNKRNRKKTKTLWSAYTLFLLKLWACIMSWLISKQLGGNVSQNTQSTWQPWVWGALWLIAWIAAANVAMAF